MATSLKRMTRSAYKRPITALRHYAMDISSTRRPTCCMGTIQQTWP